MNQSTKSVDYQSALQNARQELKKGDTASARYWAHLANQYDPQKEDPWLILAAVARPRASIEYLNQALLINPNSRRARQGMHWAVERLRESESLQALEPAKMLVPSSIAPEALVRSKQIQSPWLLLFLLCSFFLLGWFALPDLSLAFGFNKEQINDQISIIPTNTQATQMPAVVNVSVTYTATNTTLVTPSLIPSETLPPTVTETPIPTLTETPLPTNPPLPTETSLPTPTETIAPIEEPEPTLGPNGKFKMPDVEVGQHWIDVDLSQQRAYAFEGNQIVNSFLVSTGTANTPTVTGQFKIYVKYRAADMSGPGYQLEDVPFVMYFYKSYGLHGTYWHRNFGTPMSHGCVNLKTKDAKWLFEWASVGTIVNVHR